MLLDIILITLVIILLIVAYTLGREKGYQFCLDKYIDKWTREFQPDQIKFHLTKQEGTPLIPYFTLRAYVEDHVGVVKEVDVAYWWTGTEPSSLQVLSAQKIFMRGVQFNTSC